MFSYSWKDRALDELSDLYVATADPARRQRIIVAVETLNARLAANGPDEGESRPNGYRIAFAAPVGTIFRVNPGGQSTRVERVWLCGRR